MSEYKFSAALLKKCGDLKIVESTPLLVGIKKLLEDVVPAIEANDTIIKAFEKLNKGKMYECPHCKSETLLDFGKCHVCDGDLFVETLNTVSTKKSHKQNDKENGVVTVPATEVKVNDKKKKNKPEEKANTEGKSKRDPADFRKEELEALLEKVNDKKNKENALKLIAETLSITLPNPDVMNASSMRNEIKPVIEKLLKTAKPMTKVVEVDEDELLSEPIEDGDELELDDDADSAPAPAAPKKIAKDNKKSKTKEPPADDEDDLEIEDDVSADDVELEVEDDVEDEPPVKTPPKKDSKKEGKKTTPKKVEEVADDDDAIEIEDDDVVELEPEDEEVAEAEVEDDLFDLDEGDDSEDVTDF